MGKETEKEMESQEENIIIDVLYKDSYRINSFLAQLAEGVIQNIKKQQSVSNDVNKKIGSDIKVLKGEVDSKTIEQRLLEYTIDQHDSKILKLLDLLDLDELEELPTLADAKLVHLSGQISIRNLKAMSEIFPIMTKNTSLFGINKAASKNIKQLEAILKIIPLNIEMDLYLKNNKTLHGILKEEYLLSSYNNIVATYGTNLPYKWHVIGILNNKNHENTCNTSSIRIALDTMNTVVNNFISEGCANYSFIPILIFKILNK